MSNRLGLLTRLGGELRTPEEVRDAAYLMVGDTAAKQSRFWLLLVLAAAIASAGCSLTRRPP